MKRFLTWGREYFPLLLVVVFLAISAPSCADDGDSGAASLLDSASNSFVKYHDPEKRGPYAVGVTTDIFVDKSRYMVWGQMPRTFVTEIWYPIIEPGTNRNTIGDMVGEVPVWANNLASRIYGGNHWASLLETRTNAWRDAPRYIPQTPFPVIFFSHGLTAIRFQNYTLCEYLASHGFVVVAVDHYANAAFSNIPGHLIFHNPLSIVSSESQRPRDISFLIRSLKQRMETDGDFFNGLIDGENFGITGHSYGGMTSLNSGDRVGEIDAVAPLNPVILQGLSPNFAKPILFLVGDNDNLAGDLLDSSNRARLNYDPIKTDKSFIYLLNSGHYSATDACGLLPPGLISDEKTGCAGQMIDSALANQILSAYEVAFFSAALKGDSRYRQYLRTNQYPENMEYDSVWKE
jgi:dienelactone hydrolase